MPLECRFKVDYRKAFQLDIIKKISSAEVGIIAVGVLGLIPHMLPDAGPPAEWKTVSKAAPDIVEKATERDAEKVTKTALLAMGLYQAALSLTLGSLGLVVVSRCRQNVRPKRLFIALGIFSALCAACNLIAFVAHVVLGVQHLTSLPSVTVHPIMILHGISVFLFIELSGLWTYLALKTAGIAYTSLWFLKIEDQPSESFSTPPSTPGFAKEAGMVPVHQNILNDHTEMYF